MTKKHGTLQERRGARFDKSPSSATCACSLKTADIAIVPVRYALDRSHYDVDPAQLKPLPARGQWSPLPRLKTRSYTLRQLYDGYVYVFDETAGTFHEYSVSASDACLTRIVWTEAHLGRDVRSGDGEGNPYLFYPRRNRLHLAFSPVQWTWRICEHMRSHADSRALWMKPLDLANFCATLNEPGTLPLMKLATAVADIDKNYVVEDKRFADSSIPTAEPEPQPDQAAKSLFTPLGADVYWLGNVPDRCSSLLVALDDPLGVFNDLGMQLAGDQAAYQNWQQEHEHKLQMAQTVTALCGANGDPKYQPSWIRGNSASTQQFLSDREAYFDQMDLEEMLIMHGNGPGGSLGTMDLFKSADMRQMLHTRYGRYPSQEELQAWKDREKWRREVDLKGARTYLQDNLPISEALLQQVRDTQADFQTWAEHLGSDPLRLFIDTANPKTLLYLQTVMTDLLMVYGQDQQASVWLAKQEARGSTLFGTMRYGFSPGLKEALDQEANALLNGIGDFTNLATRAGELNAALNHQGFADAAWMKKLKQPVQDTFKALRELASGAGKTIAENMLLAWVPVDSRLALGKGQNLGALIRNFMIGQILANTPEMIRINEQIASRLKQWKREWWLLTKQIDDTRFNWLYPHHPRERRNLARLLQSQLEALRLHELKIPSLLDFQNNQYAQLLQDEIRAFFKSGLDVAKDWHTRAKAWSERLGGFGAGITWGVILLNFINTAFLYEDLTRDGDFSGKDIVKVGYSLGYSFNLLMAVFVEAPWAVIKNATPVLIDGKSIGILDRSSAYWKAQGNNAWGDAIRGFRSTVVALGAFAVAAAVLELWDIRGDYQNAKTEEERAALLVKGIAVFVMGVGGLAQLVTGLTLSSRIAIFVMGTWFTIGLLIAGVVYLIATMVLNYFKQDSVGWWLRRCCWSRSSEHRHTDTPEGEVEEKRSLLEIQLSPQILIKSTVEYRQKYMGLAGYVDVPVQNGAWIQMRLPEALRGQLVQLNVISSTRTFGFLPTEQTDTPIAEKFEERGKFTPLKEFGKIGNERPPYSPSDLYFPIFPAGEDVVWQTWVPLREGATYIELQIWYPNSVSASGQKAQSYLYQIELSQEGDMAVDGSSLTLLEVNKQSRANALILVLPE
ncbi:T6SS effector BTH_I2691 family protein [Pseudomonas sp. KFB-139]|uniref:T6SS effector BTH_I2691 family protein n=1 Tax=Pseudomonas serbiensis TaxID=3064350 RepID=A0ABT9CUZ9_9PSED|nr:T6SS effector BTH_I2691 family protein [Pseudomonas sp. KFB-138]MDO7928577.1 T6SS effector BTH_I2691 family protein [Pseudomonas sp. KFB-138]